MNKIRYLSKMSFNQLKKELPKCKNKNEELIIRKLMKKKYLKYMKMKKIKKKTNIYQLADDLLMDIKNNKVNDDNIDNIVNMFDESDFKDTPNFPSLNELDPTNELANELDGDELYDKKFKEEIKRDQLNNNLMNRLNSDIDIQSMRKKYKKNIEVPFSNSNDGLYASPFKNNLPNNNFNRF